MRGDDETRGPDVPPGEPVSGDTVAAATGAGAEPEYASTARKVSTAMGWSVGAKLARLAIAVAMSIVVVRGLGSHDYGVLSIVRTILTFLALICGFGLGQAVLRFMPEFRVRRDVEGLRGLFAFVLVVQLLVWAAFFALFLFKAGSLEALYRTPGLGFVLKVGVGLLVVDLVALVLSQTLTSFYDVKLLSVFTTISLLVTLGLTIAFLRLGHGIVGVLLAAAISGAMLSVALLDRCALHVPLSLRPTFRETRRLLRYSVPFAAIGVLNLITWRQSETLLLGYFRSPVEAGLFDLGYRIPQQVLELVPGAVWPLILATFAEIYSKKRESLPDAIGGYYKLLFVLVAPLSLFGAAISVPAVKILFGLPMESSGLLAQMFFLIFSVSFFSTPLSMALYVMELTWLNLIIYVCNAFVNVGLDLILIPRYGLYGAVVPVALVILASPFVYYYVLRARRVSFWIPWGFIGRCYLASLPLAGFFLVARYIDSVPGLVAACGLGGAVFWGSARAVAIFREEDDFLLRGLGPGLRRLVLGFFGWKGGS
ncbi:MAG: oligosaccharide flippase family protein [Candidatus Eiseniibacteriota bacterium]|nr:MAG: oligosaccharide flippase family protein [Candidatus Eisenbacteria bacterium]